MELCCNYFDAQSLVIDKREHIGGNCYDYIDEHGESWLRYHLNQIENLILFQE